MFIIFVKFNTLIIYVVQKIFTLYLFYIKNRKNIFIDTKVSDQGLPNKYDNLPRRRSFFVKLRAK